MAIMKYQKHYNDLDGLIDSLFTGVKIPPVDIKETKTGYAISAEIPGYKENEINLYVENHVLTLEGKKEEREDESSKDGKKYLVRERVVRNFKRSFTLPEDADEEKVSATFKNGVLEIDLPKTEKAQPKRIEVKAN